MIQDFYKIDDFLFVNHAQFVIMNLSMQSRTDTNTKNES